MAEIRGTGHETDTTLIDFAADRRAPTPTAAAEMAVPERRFLFQRLQTLGDRFQGMVRRHLDTTGLKWGLIQQRFPREEELLGARQQRLDDEWEALTLAMERRLTAFNYTWERFRQAVRSPHERLERCALQLAQKNQALHQAFRFAFQEKQQGFYALAKWLENVSYPKTLERGFCYVTQEKGVVPRAASLQPGDPIRVHFADGQVDAKTIAIKSD